MREKRGLDLAVQFLGDEEIEVASPLNPPIKSGLCDRHLSIRPRDAKPTSSRVPLRCGFINR